MAGRRRVARGIVIESLCQRASDATGCRIVALRPLDSERSEVWQVRFDGRLAVLTVRSPVVGDSTAACDFAFEIASHRRAADASVAPALLWVDADAKSFIAEWAFTPITPSITMWRAVGQQLATLHALGDAVSVRRTSLTAAAHAYAAMADARHEAHVATLVSCIADNERKRDNAETVLCHRDPGPGNIVGDTTPLLIDWEYAGPASRWFDIAVVVDGFDLDDGDQRSLLDGYTAVLPHVAADEMAIARERSTHAAIAALWRLTLPAIT
ncbi:MAG: phosphotransferase [Pseudomonadota bacterium]